MASEKIKVTAHSALLKFGESSGSPLPIKDSDISRDVISKGITTVGFDLTYAQERALHAVQVLLNQTDYEGNSSPVTPTKSARYHFKETLPVIMVKSSEYLTAYGVEKSKTYRANEFSAQGSRVAKAALRDLAMINRLIVYDKSVKEKKTKLHVEDIAPLISLEVFNGGRELRITPNPVLVDQIDSYFLLRPVDLFNTLPGKDAVAVRFIEYLLHQGEMNRRKEHAKEYSNQVWEHRIQPEGLAWKLRLGAMIRARKRTELYELGIRLGYLESFQTEQQGTKGRILDVLMLKNLVPNGAESGPNSSNI
jgi:hypothetical protein